jgi:hypothetical protein
MRNTSHVASKSLLLSVLILAAAAVLAVEVRRTPPSPAAIQSLPRAAPPQSFHEAIADTDVGPGLAEAQPLPSK